MISPDRSSSSAPSGSLSKASFVGAVCVWRHIDSRFKQTLKARVQQLCEVLDKQNRIAKAEKKKEYMPSDEIKKEITYQRW